MTCVHLILVGNRQLFEGVRHALGTDLDGETLTANGQVEMQIPHLLMRVERYSPAGIA